LIILEQDMTEANESPKTFSMQRVYVKDVSFETPIGVDAMKKKWEPFINQDINTRSKKLKENLLEVVLTLTVTASFGEGDDRETAFIVEVQQAGMFTCDGFDDEELKQMIGVTCPTMLFPYARETIDTIVIKGGFPPLMLPPLNFAALYKRVQEESASGDASTH
jgi:preprotein translocase subunit SecB